MGSPKTPRCLTLIDSIEGEGQELNAETTVMIEFLSGSLT